MMHTLHTEPALLTTPLMYSLWKVSAVSGPGLLLLWCSGLALEDNLSAILVTAELQHNNTTTLLPPPPDTRARLSLPVADIT